MVVICDDFGTEFVVREFVVRPLNIMVGRNIFPFVQNPMISYCHVWWREGKVNTWDLNLVVEPRASFPIHGTKRSSGWWFQPLWKILVNWDHYSQYMENHKSHVPNHQSDMYISQMTDQFITRWKNKDQHKSDVDTWCSFSDQSMFQMVPQNHKTTLYGSWRNHSRWRIDF